LIKTVLKLAQILAELMLFVKGIILRTWYWENY